MLITKTPFRMSFCGGGSDLPSFYKIHDGCVLSTSINKYMYISVHPNFLNSEQIIIKYSKTEIVESSDNIEHPIVRSVLKDMGIKGVEITSTADIPSGTGLGSSSTFTVGLIHALSCYMGKYSSKIRLAEKACDVEINKLQCPIGKQDQYAAALGGFNFFQFHSDDTVTQEPVLMSGDTKRKLDKNLLMFYLGSTRSANEILEKQNNNLNDNSKVKNLVKMCDLAKTLKDSLNSNNLGDFGEILHENWLLKKSLAQGISNSEIDDLYSAALGAGATGGKLLGAGAGGFLLLYCEQDKQDKLRYSLNLPELPFNFENDGTSVVYIGDKYWDE